MNEPGQMNCRTTALHRLACGALAWMALAAGGCCCSRPGIRVHGDCSLELGPPTAGDCDEGCSSGHSGGAGGLARVLPPPVDSGVPAVSPDARFHPVPTRPVFGPKTPIERSPQTAPEPIPMPSEPSEERQAARPRHEQPARRTRPVRSVWVEPASAPRRNHGRPVPRVSREPHSAADDATSE